MIPLCVLLHICVAVNPGGSGSGGAGSFDGRIGVNYGRVADNLPEPNKTVTLLTAMNVGTVKLFDANAQVLIALANTKLKVTIMVRNEDIGMVSASEDAGEQWVTQNVLPYPSTQITVIVVGNEIFSYPAISATWTQLLPAMENLRKALLKHNLGNIKVTTSVAGDVLSVSYPPSDGAFRTDIRDSVLKPMLKFLQDTDSPFYINLYPYFAWLDNPVNISLDYALFDPKATTVKDGKLKYTNLLDAMVDATFSAMEKLGFDDVTLGISETGWPSGGDPSEKGATVANAATYNRRLVRKVLANPPTGTPKRPHAAIPTFIFALFNEDLKPGPARERYWGLLYPDGRPVYQIDLTGRLSDSQYDTAQQPSSVATIQTSTRSTQPGSWCVAKPDADKETLQAALDYACGPQGKADCAAIQADQSCYLPNTLIAHASYAFHSSWQNTGGKCSFSGAAQLTSVDPGHGSCVFPSN